MPIVLRRSTALSVVSAALLLSACGPTSSTSSLPTASGAAGPGSAPASTTRNASTLSELATTHSFTGYFDVPPETVPVACPPITSKGATVYPDAITITGRVTMSGNAHQQNNGDFEATATFNAMGLHGEGWEEVPTTTGNPPNTYDWTGFDDHNQYSFTGGGTVQIHVNHDANTEFDVQGTVTVGGAGPDAGDTAQFHAHVRYDPIKGRMFTGNVDIKFTTCSTTTSGGGGGNS